MQWRECSSCWTWLLMSPLGYISKSLFFFVTLHFEKLHFGQKLIYFFALSHNLHVWAEGSTGTWTSGSALNHLANRLDVSPLCCDSLRLLIILSTNVLPWEPKRPCSLWDKNDFCSRVLLSNHLITNLIENVFRQNLVQIRGKTTCTRIEKPKFARKLFCMYQSFFFVFARFCNIYLDLKSYLIFILL